MSCASHALVLATVGAGTVLIPYFGVAITKGGGKTAVNHLYLQQSEMFSVMISGMWRNGCMERSAQGPSVLSPASDGCYLQCVYYRWVHPFAFSKYTFAIFFKPNLKRHGMAIHTVVCSPHYSRNNGVSVRSEMVPLSAIMPVIPSISTPQFLLMNLRTPCLMLLMVLLTKMQRRRGGMGVCCALLYPPVHCVFEQCAVRSRGVGAIPLVLMLI